MSLRVDQSCFTSPAKSAKIPVTGEEKSARVNSELCDEMRWPGITALKFVLSFLSLNCGSLGFAVLNENSATVPAVSSYNDMKRSAGQAYASGDLAGALDIVDRYLLSVPNHVEAIVVKASLLVSMQRIDEALPLVNKAISLEPGNADHYAMLAMILVSQGDKRGLQVLEKALELDPNNADAIKLRNELIKIGAIQ